MESFELIDINKSYFRFHIIMTTFNRVDLLEKTLDSLLNNVSFPNIKLWIMESGSSDRTKEFLSSYNHEFLETVCLSNKRVAQHDQLNRGFGLVSSHIELNKHQYPYSNYIIKVEDDLDFHEQWLEYLFSSWMCLSGQYNLGMIGGYAGSYYKDYATKIGIGDKHFRLSRHCSAPIMFSSYSIWNAVLPILWRARNDPPRDGAASEVDWQVSLRGDNSILSNGKMCGFINVADHIGENESTWKDNL